LINLSIENIVFIAELGRRGQKLFEKLGNNVKPQSQMLSGFHGNTLWSAEELLIKNRLDPTHHRLAIIKSEAFAYS
jgi:hypothetical protein